MKILLIEDDEILVNVLLQSLTSQRYVVDTASDGQTGWEYAQSSTYDLILVDVGLPKLDGIALCHQLRSGGCSTPILLMTAKDASSDRIRGLDAGADDYLIKPLDLGELQARVRALLRRGNVPCTSVLEVGTLRLDPSSCQVTYNGKLLELTPKEYSLLELFLRNPSRVFSRGNIIEHLWTFDDPPLEESVKSHIKGLRQKLKAAGAVDWIENVYGLGYRLNPKVMESGKNPEQSSQFQNNALPESTQPQDKIPTPDLSPAVELQFNQAMDGLWEQYQGLMSQRLEVLQQAAAAIPTGTLSQELRQSAQQAAHKLAGVLGMFELEAGTLISREIEQLLLGDGTFLTHQESNLIPLVQNLSNLLSLKTPLASGESLSRTAHMTKTAPSVQKEDDETLVSHVSKKVGEEQTLSKQNWESSTARVLLIDPDRQVGSALQELAQSAGINWQQMATLEQAKIWLQSKSPDLVILSVDEVGHQEESLALLADLATRTPPVPVLVLAAAQGLLDRVTVARSGGRGFLVKPITPAQVWDAASQLLRRTRSLGVNVLVVDDDPVFLGALRPMLEPWGIRMTGLNDPLRFWDVLESVTPDLLILDVQMPQLSGIELCQAVRTAPQWQGLPILFLTAHRDIETIQQVFAAGADDYVVKPVVGPELLTRITNRLERVRLLETLSSKDPITRLANQPQSSRHLEHLIEQAKENCHPVCLVVLSATQLHQINVQYSHAAGNQVLQQWGRLFQTVFRSGEVLGYWGNGEFIVGISGLTKKEASDRLFEVLTTLRQQVFTASDGNRFQATCSFAIAEYPTDGVTLQSLYQVASSLLDQTRRL
ncbi:MAG: response regulator [Aphanothece sp. CMT-3BRIN-NPC111]|jgi:diguanylate cyclase (GGDEF)-like protein|nr:response regulator [Aphanothece sp. CMT-3BRIN-NPC111]